ncbi:arginine--tRNA ligase [Pantoea sp. B566]|uniref:arginine--tRNA ligase n=1 Tax=Pantoea TaxID=53335 RepID=UPI00190387FB|nr:MULTISPECIES: arginine--tRNA ligase [Pantoea]MCS3404403.1 arginine--tRNA ligase [Pantoea sp. B566]
MSIISILDEKFSNVLRELGADNCSPTVQAASRPEFGDFQVNGVMAAAKKLGLQPRKLALQLIERVQLNDIAEKLEIAGPGFINIFIDNKFIEKKIEYVLKSPNLGINIPPSKRVMVEYASVNLAKEMHVGHLRGSIIGDALARINIFMGQDVVLQSHVGDWGTQFGMLLAQMNKENNTDIKKYELADLNSFYQQAKRSFDESIDFANISRDYVVRLQHGDSEVMEMWESFVEISLSHALDIFDKLNLLLKKSDIRGESFYRDDLQPLIQELYSKNLLCESQGAKIVSLDEYKNKVGENSAFIVQKQDGGYLYATTDLAAIRFRIKELQIERCLYIVDVRQSLHFKQLFLVARKAGFLPPAAEFEHISHGTIKGNNGKPLKTKSGESVKLDALLTEAIDRAESIIISRNPNLDDKSRQALAKIVGIGALKYADLSRNRISDYVFDWNSMLSFEGNTAPYLQYAYARANRVLNKVGSFNIINSRIEHSIEHDLALEILRFEDVMLQVIRESSPHILCNYLYSLSALFSRFYESCPVILQGNANGMRLKLCELTSSILKKGLELLGIEVSETM